ncbi:MAG: IS110 family transposase [Planctomycetota bacterium]|nr:MAG: IS110 family transposase [Planctomycetota bacterium]
MLYVGLDVHLNHISVCVLDENGKRLRRARVPDASELIKLLTSLGQPLSVCYEASCGYGRWHEILSHIAARVVVAHPGHLNLIFRSKRKHDAVDAEKLAKLLVLDAVPAVHVPPAKVRAWRELISFRQKLVHKRTRAKNAIRALLRSLGIVAPKRPRLWTDKGIAWLQGLEIGQPALAIKRDMLLEEIATFDRQIGRVEGELARFARTSAAVALLRTIPGIGIRTAEAVVAFLDDPQRFASSKQVGAYFGLVPAQDQSGDKNRLGHITREGAPVVRHYLTEAVWQACRLSPTIGAYRDRVQRDDPQRKKVAVVATAHYLVRVMWSMLRHQRTWQELVTAA